jgi:hypothetical protein
MQLAENVSDGASCTTSRSKDKEIEIRNKKEATKGR